MRIQFLGANRQVTGSRTLLEVGKLKVMVDCGLFQERPFIERNWTTSPVPPHTVDVLLLTHAHLDHCGLVPRLVKQGFRRKIVTTEPSVDLAKIVMEDSAEIQEEDAAYKKKRHRREGRRGRHPEVPLYTRKDAREAAKLLDGVPYGREVRLADGVFVTFHDAGHILGSSIVEISVAKRGERTKVVFSGDLGQRGKPLIRDPSRIEEGHYVIMESTYGDRDHREAGDVVDQLEGIINETAKRGGNVVIPTFAIERAQELMYHLSRLVHADRIPDLPIYLDSPMATDVTDVFRRYHDYLDAETQALFQSDEPPLRFPGLQFTPKAQDSRRINESGSPKIILASSGMCTGGRIKHHLRQNIDREDSTILFVGYQSTGTLGRHILNGDERVRIHGRHYPVRARIAQIFGFSAHADRADLLDWLGSFQKPPRRLFLNHGEASAAESLAKTVRSRLGWQVSVPEYQESHRLDA